MKDLVLLDSCAEKATLKAFSASSKFEEFKELWQTEKSNRIVNELDHLIFIVAYPDDLEWSFIVEKQTITNQISISCTRALAQ